MKLKLDQYHVEQLKAAAKKEFPEAYFHFDKTDLFMKGVEDGEFTCDFIDHPIFVSTQYAYEDIMVNENPTRYKIQIHSVELLDSEYNVNYTWKDRYFAIYEENNQLCFMEYGKFLEFIKKDIQSITK